MQNTPLELSKDYKIHEKRGLKKAGREEEEKEKAGGTLMKEDRLRCENICILLKY